MGRIASIIDNVCQKWKDKTTVKLETFAVRKSFTRNIMTGDIPLRYIQFPTLHRRFYTNNIKVKIRIKDLTPLNVTSA